MNGDQLLMQDIGLDAVKYMERAFNSLSQEVQAQVMAGVHVGGTFEVRVRMAAQRQMRISLVLIGDRGELELHALGGGPTK